MKVAWVPRCTASVIIYPRADESRRLGTGSSDHNATENHGVRSEEYKHPIAGPHMDMNEE